MAAARIGFLNELSALYDQLIHYKHQVKTQEETLKTLKKDRLQLLVQVNNLEVALRKAPVPTRTATNAYTVWYNSCRDHALKTKQLKS